MLSILGMYNYDSSIFDGLVVPVDDDCQDMINKEVLVETILLQNAELELLYTEPETLKRMIGLWSASSKYSWKKLADTLYLKYNPIWNKDGTITEHEEGTSESEASESVAAYNSSSYEPRNHSEGSAGSGRDYTRIEQGNIGVTSTQQLIKEERDTADFNIYDRISLDFRNRFCIQVY